MALLLILTAALFILGACLPARNTTGRWDREAASQAILEYYQKLLPDLNPAVKFPVEDVTTDEIWEQLHIQIFRVTEGIYENESFILNGGNLIQMGTAFGGFGVNSLAVSDLNQDNQLELLFTYSFGSGIHRTHIAAYAPNFYKDRIIECDLEYLGDLQLVKLSNQDIEVQIIDMSLEEGITKPVYNLGTLSLIKQQNSELALILDVNPSLPTEFYAGIVFYK